MSIEALNCFLNDVVRFHELATGLKALSSHDQIIAFGQSQGFDFTESEWNTLFNQDFELQSDSIQQSILSANPGHWSWAFRQHTVWRAMMMDGAGDGSA